jgi:hypothetical protein
VVLQFAQFSTVVAGPQEAPLNPDLVKKYVVRDDPSHKPVEVAVVLQSAQLSTLVALKFKQS